MEYGVDVSITDDMVTQDVIQKICAKGISDSSFIDKERKLTFIIITHETRPTSCIRRNRD